MKITEPLVEGAPGGFSIVAELGLSVEEVGLYYVCLLLNDEEVARSPFTIALQQLPADE